MVVPAYAPKQRVVIELSRPMIRAVYYNGQRIEPEDIGAQVQIDDQRITVDILQDKIKVLTGVDLGIGSVGGSDLDVEVLFVAEPQ